MTARMLLMQAIKSVQEGDDPPGVGPSYHGIRAIERVLPVDVPWRDVLTPENYPKM